MRDLLKFFSKNSIFFLFLALEGISLMLIVNNHSFQRSSFINFTRDISGFVFSRFQVSRDYLQLHKTNLRLNEEIARLKNEMAGHKAVAFTDSLGISVREPGRYSYYPAQVINNTVYRQYNYITLNAGRKAGIHEDMAVISVNGVVGIISGVSEHFSTVLPVLNRNFKLSAKIKRNNFFGIAEWNGLSPSVIKLKEIPLHAGVLPGDTVVTSGYSNIFPEGIMIGFISKIREDGSNFYDLEVKLFNDFGNLYHVTVIDNILREEQVILENQTGI